MEVFVRKVPEQCSNNQLKEAVRPYMKACGIEVFHCNKFSRKSFGTITVLDIAEGQRFLQSNGDGPLRNLNINFAKCNISGVILRFTKSKNEPDDMVLKSLRKEVSDRALNRIRHPTTGVPAPRLERQYPYTSLSCGLWEYENSNLAFVPYYHDSKRGKLMFGKQALALLVEDSGGTLKRYRIDFSYISINLITLGDFRSPSVTFTLSEAPKIFGVSGEDLALHALFSNLRVQGKTPPQRKRLSSLGNGHEHVAGSCLVYRVLLQEPSSLRSVQNLLNQGERFPPSISCATPVRQPSHQFYIQMAHLSRTLNLTNDKISFGVKFQLQRLAQSSFLPPMRVSQLIREVTKLSARAGNATCVEVVRKLFKQIPFAGPDADTNAFDLDKLIELLHENEKKTRPFESYNFALAESHSHIALVHSALVTPTSVYLAGPEPENKNRVLRKYSKKIDYFLRVSFADENGEKLFYDRNVSLEEIYQGRFKTVLETSIDIAGRKFEFLGFSHSSLREQTCWFMAPFLHDGALLDARGVIAALGDFSDIRCPAKCAARIGQAFSDTNGTVQLPPGTVGIIPDIERNGRIFSDGVGTFSYDFLRRVWVEYGLKSGTTAKLLQIRWAGAKGMISLDTRLKGEKVLFRKSQIKFESPDQSHIEICGPASCLPMRLNRQFIKIMEDLGVIPQTFIDLQDDAVHKLQETTTSASKAAKFLEANRIGSYARVPWLLRKLSQIDLEPLHDPFLRGVVELATLIELRELKYRTRIPVKDGVTLFGILDETNTLEEGQIYCSTGNFVVTGKVTITRAPALHPGDVRTATCVEVPQDSPLNELSNCIVFSQRGDRDLPSKLSGGDLDGDLYQLMWDDRLLPKMPLVDPADYPRAIPIDIGRPVVRSDMTEFFINFMENDQLGRIATLHVQLADISKEGTNHKDCLTLASMHSDAVDFSKTGIPADMKKLPRHRYYRPDFMAPGPRCMVEKLGIEIDDDDLASVLEEEGDLISQLDPESTKMRYYESDKILGTLYRRIDEHKFLRNLKVQSKDTTRISHSKPTLMDQIWSWVKEQTFLIEWDHNKNEAREIREVYENCLINTMYQYGSSSSNPLTETEVFVGSVLGKNTGVPSKKLRETASDMKERFNRDLEYTNRCILNGHEESEVDRDEALARSIACLAVAMEEPGMSRPRIGRLQSFAYVAAGVCLKEIEYLHGKHVGSVRGARQQLSLKR